MKKLIFIGAGNVATHLACQLYKCGFEILQIYSRTIESAKNLSDKVNSEAISDIEKVRADADFYIFAIKDSALENIARKIPLNKGIWLHTAGSMPLSIFELYSKKFGVFYPFQTFSKDRDINWTDIPIFIEGSDPEIFEIVRNLAENLSNQVTFLSSDKRRYLHLTGVFACNFVNHMYTLSEEILKHADIPFNVALPLIEETCAKIHHLPPIDAQTGPAVRFDENVMNKHLDMIEDKQTKKIYRIISESIHKFASKNK